MSHFTLQFGGDGPILNAFLGVSAARRAALEAAGQPVPSYVGFRALVDTGASCSCVDPSVIAKLGITPTGTMPVHTPSTGGTPHVLNQYDVSLIIPGPLNAAPHIVNTLPISETHLLAQGIEALLGRDILKDCLLTYNGPMGLYTLAF